MINMRIFLDETESLFKLFAKKITFFLTQPTVRDEIIKLVKDMIGSRMLFDGAMAIDCCPDKSDAVRDMIDALRQVYIGIPIPDTITVPPPEDTISRRHAMEVFVLLLK